MQTFERPDREQGNAHKNLKAGRCSGVPLPLQSAAPAGGWRQHAGIEAQWRQAQSSGSTALVVTQCTGTVGWYLPHVWLSEAPPNRQKPQTPPNSQPDVGPSPGRCRCMDGEGRNWGHGLSWFHAPAAMGPGNGAGAAAAVPEGLEQRRLALHPGARSYDLLFGFGRVGIVPSAQTPYGLATQLGMSAACIFHHLRMSS